MPETGNCLLWIARPTLLSIHLSILSSLNQLLWKSWDLSKLSDSPGFSYDWKTDPATYSTSLSIYPIKKEIPGRLPIPLLMAGLSIQSSLPLMNIQSHETESVGYIYMGKRPTAFPLVSLFQESTFFARLT